MRDGVWIIGKLAVAAIVVGLLSGCGVKSSPARPDDSTFGLKYPAPAREMPAAPIEKTPVKRKTAPSGYNDGDYQPPRPATETLAQ